MPVGIKIGNMVSPKPYGFIGGGIDAPVNYREKTFVIRDQKTKFSEWFSQRTPSIMPYVFIGISTYQGITLKAQYYPGNFMNADFSSKGVKPYSGMEVHVAMLSIGFPMQISKHRNMTKKPVETVHMM